MNWRNWMLGSTLAMLLAACGGGGSGSSSAYGLSGNKNNSVYGIGSAGSGSGSTGSTDVISNVSGAVVLSLSRNTISASQPGTVTAVVKDAAGVPISGALVQFTLSGNSSTGLAILSPASAITDANGQAATILTPATGATAGAAYVNATADTTAGALVAKKAFSVSALNVQLSDVTLTPTSISGYNTSSIAITVVGASSSTPVTVNVSSTCASSGKAAISPATLTMTGTGGTVTYQDKGCGSSGSTKDRISVQIVGTTEQIGKDLDVSAPVTQGIQFVSVDNPTICQKGTGCASVANVVFKVIDQSGAAQPGLRVDFSLDNGAALLGSMFGITGSDGQVSVAVAANRTPSPVRVIAKVQANGITLQTVSNTLTISGGLPVASDLTEHNGISFAASKYSLNYEYESDYADLILRLTDRWGAPAVDGTVVNLVSDGGTVVPAYCVTQGGTGGCAVRLVVSNPKPLNGRVHVVAYANGQEYFDDANGSAEYDLGQPGPSDDEAFDDVKGAVCLDRNENRTCEESEYLVGKFNLRNAGNGTWDDGGSAFARIQHTFFFAYASVEPRLFKVSGGACTATPVNDAYMTVTMNGQSSASLQFCVRDGNANADTPYLGNPMPSGTTISALPTMSNAAVTIGNATVSSGASAPTLHTLTVQNTATVSPQPALASGTATLTFTLAATGASAPAVTGSLPPPIVLTQKVFILP